MILDIVENQSKLIWLMKLCRSGSPCNYEDIISLDVAVQITVLFLKISWSGKANLQMQKLLISTSCASEK